MQEKGKIMLDSWELEDFSRADRFFHSASAYLECSYFLFKSIIDRSIKTTFSHAQAASFLFEHSLELFFKGTIMQAGKKPCLSHDLSQLYREFKQLYPGKRFSPDIKIEEICTEDAQRPYSEYNRYPVDNSGNLWPKPSFYDPHSFVSQIILLQDDYVNVISQIKEDN